jgi:putative acetyltransferase
VRPEARGLGLALQLLRLLEDSAVEAGAEWALLQTGRPQLAALGLYRKAGYTPVTPFGFFAGMADAVHLGRRLVRPE